MNKLIPECAVCARSLSRSRAPCFADTVNGVLAEERVVNLPNDSGKWYVSVVGNANDARYNEIVGWFDTNASLKKLKNQVHFCPVTSDTAIYKERYASNVKGLPTVRVQKPDGTVVYEAAGKNIPMTAGRAERRDWPARSAMPRASGRFCLGGGKWSGAVLARARILSRNRIRSPTPSRSRLTTAARRFLTIRRSRAPSCGVCSPCCVSSASRSALPAATASRCTGSCIRP